jgi:hypothetical protein
MHFKIVKSDSSIGHALKSSIFPFNLSFWRCLLQKHSHFRENFRGNENFCENFRETKFRGNMLIFAFREDGKKPFSFQRYSFPEILFILHSHGSCPAPPETVGEAGIEPGTAAWQPGISQWT